MLNQARARLYVELCGIEFVDDEFPGWWYSPARDPKIAAGARAGDAGARSDVQEDVDERTHLQGDEGYDVVPPRTPSSREEVPGRPILRDDALRDGSLRASARNDGSLRDTADDFTTEELNLLGSKGVVRSPLGEWFHSERYPDGRMMITPVNPHAELRRLSDVRANGAVIN